MRFTLEIELGNAAMETGEDLARALHNAAATVDAGGTLPEGESGTIRDENGNTVGRWEVVA